MQQVPTNDAIAVAMKTPPCGIPLAPRMLGLTARMYTIARKVVRPAIISRPTVVLFSFSLKKSVI